ncbi:uncharacterized protein LOC123561167 [Mercenaria mercenaria]|uniref:uncharacterized protein LOC123561167 n=1 Tax=Mercenaria mercenaria TaxID=6596 RepID=UPI00234FA615|nr:uncharacterized protein LOC123561167 [Mercenaria mercenaria]
MPDKNSRDFCGRTLLDIICVGIKYDHQLSSFKNTDLSTELNMDDEIAIVGIGCRFPGADNIDEYWRLLVNGENHVKDIPLERWNNDAFYSEDKDEPGKHYVKKAGFISKHDEWDNRLFQVSDNEAIRIDPQQRYVLECTHMAMEDGGITRKDLQGTSTGVYIGVMNDDYKVIASSDHSDDTNYSATGMSTTIIASRVSFVYNLQGPCMVIDTACSSSMIAIHLGCQAIRTGDCEMAVCGGVSSIISPDTFIALCKARMMSATGQCQTFCDSADGYARGEGCGVVILKSYKKALKDGNKIWGILKTGSNQDGRVSQPITAPSGEQQEELLKKVYKQYGVNPTSLQYIEAHGTGTPIGDPTEANALGRFIASCREQSQIVSHTNDRRPSSSDSGNPSEIDTSDSEKEDTVGIDAEKSEGRSNPDRYSAFSDKTIPIGSVKTNIGHTESAAGVAALIKVLLMMKNGKIVPSLHVKKDKSNLNKKIKLDEYGLDIALDVVDWLPNEDGDRICCVNSFGFGGSNSHAIVVQNTRMPYPTISSPLTNEMSAYKTVCLSSLDTTSLINTMEHLNEDLSNGVSLQDVSYTSAFHRDHYPTRTILFGKDVEEIQQQIKVKMQNIEKLETNKTMRKVFVFCGVGTTWQGMCAEMMATQPVFRNKISAIDQYLQPLSGWSIAEKFRNEATDYSDPFLNHIAIFCTQVALFALWRSWGITPDTIIGQSVGEVAASYASGALPLKDAVSVIYYRSKILAEMTGGKMMVAGNYAIEDIESLCEKYDNKVTIAVYNSPTSCTLSGDADVMETIKSELEDMNDKDNADIMIRPLSVQCAYHSHQVDPCMDMIEAQLKDIQKGVRRIEHISTVTGEIAEDEEFQTGRYWAENIRQPVRFMHAILKASREGVTNVFVEIGPRQVLRAHLPNIMGEILKGVCLPSMNGKKECVSVYSSLSTLYELGSEIDWKGLVPTSGHAVSSPRYGFNKSKILYIPESSVQMLQGIPFNSDQHMYVRRNGGGKAEFRILIDKETTPFVYDHYFLNAILVPGATYVEAALECGQRKSNLNAYEISVSTEFVKPFTPPDEKQYQIDIEMTEDEDIDGHRYTAKRDDRTLCHGTIVRRSEPERAKVDISHIQSRCKSYKNKEESYSCLERIDFNYGESLSLIEQSWSSATECLVEFIVPEEVKIQGKATHLHPSIIDAMFQTFGILSTIGTDGPTLPKGLSSIVINRPPQGRMYGYSQMVKATPAGNHYNSLLLSTDGHVIAEIKNFYTKTIRISDAPNQSLVYDINWKKVPQQEISEDAEQTENVGGKVVIFGTKRFINCYRMAEDSLATSYELNDSLPDTEVMYRMAFDQTNNIRAIVFAPCYHVQNVKNENKSVYHYAKHTFLSLAMLIKVIQENNASLPVFVVTESVKAATTRNIHASNVCGSELWGMVRSALAETAYSDLRLIDMSLTDENAIALESVLNRSTVNYNEYLIDSGEVFYSEFIEDPEQDKEPNYREIDYEATEELVLKSTNPAVVTNPHYQFKTKNVKDANMANSCKIRLHTIFNHDSALYPTSTVSEDAENNYWPENDENGFQVVCLEGIGWLEDKNKKPKKIIEKTPKLGFCYPVDVSSVVDIPSKCIFDIGCLQPYTPGTMTVGVLLWNIVECCKQSSSVFVIVEDDGSTWITLLKNMLSKWKKVTLKIETKEKVVDPSTEFGMSAQTLIVLSTITAGHIEVLRRKFSAVQKIVSLEEYFPRYMQRWVHHNMKGLSVNILNTEKLFTYTELTEKVPKVYSWLKTLDNSVKESLSGRTYDEYDGEEETSIFNLPYPELPLLEGKNNENYIPLKVFRTEVFRKDGCYILVGGLTGLGWELLQLMAELGAGYISTLSRRPPSEERMTEIADIQKRYGCRILPVQVDITDLNGLKKALQDLQSKLGEVQIKGVFHGGGVINDMLLNMMTLEDVEKPLQPKVLGTWNLHIATLEMPLDFFVVHSSIVAIFGNPGQCNYAAGNSFQDSFAHYRRSLGLCGQSINWSTLSLGMAAENKEMEKNFKSQGFYYLNVDDIRACFLRAVMTNPPQVTFGIFDWSIMEFHPTIKSYPFKFARLLEKYGTKNATFKKTDSKYHFDVEEYNNSSDDDKKNMLVDLIKKMAADTFIVDGNTLNEESRFVTLGIDSMAAMSFANSVFDTMQVRIPVVTLLSDSTTIESLTLYLIENIQNGGGSSSGGGGASDTTREDNRRLLDFLRGTVTFMQKSLLNDYVINSHSRNLSRQADYEVMGLKLKPKDWRVMLNHLIKMNPELRRIYKINKEEFTYESILLPADDIDVDMEQVPFDSICNGDDSDDRDHVYFDLTKDLPIRFKIACKKNVTRMRMYIHSVISDLSGVAMLFRDIGTYMKPYICNEPLPEKDTSIVPADAVRTALTPRMSDLKQYWKMQLSQDIQPFTFADDIDEELDETNWYQITEEMPLELVNEVMDFTKSNGISLYNFIVPVYMLHLHEKTNKDLIPLVTNVDMRGHVPQLKSFVTRCINAMPVIGDLRNMGKVGEYIKRSSASLHRTTQQSAFPYDLIQEEITSEALKKHIGRHRLVMDNMAHMNQTIKHNRVTIKVSNVHHTRYVYETTLYIMYDLQQNKVALQYGYNKQAVRHEDAALVPGRLMELMKAFIDHQDAYISEILSGNIVISSVPKHIASHVTTPHQKSKKGNNTDSEQKIYPGDRKGRESRLSKLQKELTKKIVPGQQYAVQNPGSELAILREDCFIKQTSQGWEHMVQVSLALDMSIKNNGELVLQWGKVNSSYKRHLQVDCISEVAVKKLNGTYNILLRTANKWFVLKTMSQTLATDWLNTLKNAVEEKKSMRKESGASVHHF